VFGGKRLNLAGNIKNFEEQKKLEEMMVDTIALADDASPNLSLP
jgi:hypothetical protein